MGTLCTQAAQAEGNAAKVQQVLLALLCTEGVGFMVLAIVTIIRLLGSIRVHRMALFNVFLAVPHTFLRTLASKSVSIGTEDGDEEEGEWSRTYRRSLSGLCTCPCTQSVTLVCQHVISRPAQACKGCDV